MQRKVYKYTDIVTEKDNVLLLGPGLPSYFGGIYNYILLWHSEINTMTKKYKLLINNNFPINSSTNIIRKDTFSDKTQIRVKIISILGVVLPVKIMAFIFNRDYKLLVSEFSVVHILSSSFLTYPLIKVLFFFKKEIKIIHTLHDPKSHDEKIAFIGKKLKEYYLKKIYLLSAKKDNFYLHIHSEKLLDDCPNYSNNIIIHPHPVYKKLINKAYCRKNNKVRFGFMGRIEKYKGLDVMFDAFKSIEKEMGSFIEIIIIGRGDFNKEKWKNELEYDVFITNEIVSDDFFHEQMNSLDCLLLPYIKASQSGVGYMALTYNIPIIATDTGGLPDIVCQSNQKSSMLIPNNNSKKLAEAIETFVMNKTKLQ